MQQAHAAQVPSQQASPHHQRNEAATVLPEDPVTVQQGHAASVASYQTPYPLVAPVPSYQAPDVYTGPASSPPPLVARNLTAELVSVSRDTPNQPRVIDSQARKAGQGDREGQAGVGGRPQNSGGVPIQSAGVASAGVSGSATEGHFAWEPYDKMSMDLIRKECTLRAIKVHTRTNKADRIKCLRHYDRLVNSGERASSASMQAAGNTRRTKHCMFRLINCLMSKDMINRLIEITGKNFDRQDLDDIQASQKAQFWREVALKYGRDDEDCKGLISDDEAFVGIDPSYIVPHNAAKLEELWSEVRSFFSIYEANFRMSGTHSRHFKNFVRGQFDVLYLWYWLQLRPEALSNVRGGLYQEDEYDSLDAFSTTPVRERRSSSVATPNRQNGGKKRAERSPARGSLGNKKSKSDSDSMDVLLTLVGRIVTAREAEVALGREQEQEVVVRVRAERHKMLDDIRKRISDIECEMSAAASPVKRRLKGDLDFFLEERQRIMDLVRSQGH